MNRPEGPRPICLGLHRFPVWVCGGNQFQEDTGRNYFDNGRTGAGSKWIQAANDRGASHISDQADVRESQSISWGRPS